MNMQKAAMFVGVAVLRDRTTTRSTIKQAARQCRKCPPVTCRKTPAARASLHRAIQTRATNAFLYA